MTARAATEARIAALPRCRHGRTYGGGPASLASVECRVCLDEANDVDDFLEAYPGGGDLRDVAEALGCSTNNAYRLLDEWRAIVTSLWLKQERDALDASRIVR